MRRAPMPKRGQGRTLLGAAIAALTAVVLVALIGASSASANGVALAKGDVLAGVGNGVIKHFDATGKLLDELNNGTLNNYDTGMCFDAGGNLLATDFQTPPGISRFDSGGNLLAGSFGSGYNASPESCTVDGSGNIYVGQVNGSNELLELNASGEVVTNFKPETGPRGTDWVDLAKDQCTLDYTSEGGDIKAFNVCTNKQLTAFATGLPAPCFAHRILSDGSELVACNSAVKHINTLGEVIKTYTFEGTLQLFALNLDPDKKTFWTGDDGTGQVWRVNIETGEVVTTFNSTPPRGLFGLAVVGEITAAPKIELTPTTAENPVGTNHTVTATVTEGGEPQSGVTVAFTVTGANATSGTGSTNAKGEATFTFKGETAGTSTIVASFKDKSGKTDESNSAKKIWKEAAISTCGNTNVGKVTDKLLANIKRVNACTLPVNATATELSVYLSPTSTAGQQLIEGIVYADSKGKPKELLAKTTQLTFTSKSAAGWYHLTFPVPVKLAAGNYWIGIISGVSKRVAAESYEPVKNAEDYNTNTYTSGPSNPFGSFKTTNELMSLYLSYTREAGR